MRSIGVGRDAGFANGLSDFGRDLVDPWMMDPTLWDMDDAMAIALEQPDLGVLGVAPDGQACPVAVADAGRSMDARPRQTRDRCDLDKARPGVPG